MNVFSAIDEDLPTDINLREKRKIVFRRNTAQQSSTSLALDNQGEPVREFATPIPAFKYVKTPQRPDHSIPLQFEVGEKFRDVVEKTEKLWFMITEKVIVDKTLARNKQQKNLREMLERYHQDTSVNEYIQ